MKFENFKKSLESKVYRAYYITGEDIFLMYRALSILENYCNFAYPDLNYKTFNLDSKVNIEDVIDACNGVPIFDKLRLVVVKGTNFKKNTLAINSITNYLQNPNKNCIFVYFDSTKSELFESVKNLFEVIDCNKLSTNLSKQFLINELAKQNKTITDEAFTLLHNNCDGLLSEMIQEIKKCAALSASEITYEIVFNNTEKTLEYHVFELSDALSKRQKEKVISIYEKLILDKNNKDAIIPVLGSQFNRALHVKLNSDLQLLSSELKVKEYAIIKSKEMASLFTQKQLKEICDEILKYEHMTKSGMLNIDNALSCLINSLIDIIF